MIARDFKCAQFRVNTVIQGGIGRLRLYGLRMDLILQNHIPFDALADISLPGIAPLSMDEWLIVDEAYAGQMTLRRLLLSQTQDKVVMCQEGAKPATQELLSLVLHQLAVRGDFNIKQNLARCPDGETISIVPDAPLATLGALVQEDFCILQKQSDEHVLTAAVLCFPASWTLAQKFGKPLLAIHTPVSAYDTNIAKRVQRLFDGVRAGRPLWRKNAMLYQSPDLFQPRTEEAPRAEVGVGEGPFLRSERQSILRLPETDAIVFSIHTYVVQRDMYAAP